jgi:hypothetical protein
MGASRAKVWCFCLALVSTANRPISGSCCFGPPPSGHLPEQQNTLWLSYRKILYGKDAAQERRFSPRTSRLSEEVLWPERGRLVGLIVLCWVLSDVWNDYVHLIEFIVRWSAES